MEMDVAKVEEGVMKREAEGWEPKGWMDKMIQSNDVILR